MLREVSAATGIERRGGGMRESTGIEGVSGRVLRSGSSSRSCDRGRGDNGGMWGEAAGELQLVRRRFGGGKKAPLSTNDRFVIESEERGRSDLSEQVFGPAGRPSLKSRTHVQIGPISTRECKKMTHLF